jgi:hypothetical protein
VPLPTIPVPPIHSAVIRNTNTPTGWNSARCSGGDQPRRLHHTVPTMPARPVAPPITPLTTPTVPSASRPASAAEASLGRISWDADFLYGPRTASGEDSYVLCQINVISVFAIPDQVPAAIAHLALGRLRSARDGLP